MTPGSRTRPDTVAVMQPYLFPYLGYFQLIAASGSFVFYDDVAFIKGGWINRNRVLAPGGGLQVFSAALDGGQSSSRSIADTPLSARRDWQRKFARTLRESYARAPHVDAVCALVDRVLDAPGDSIADLACRSVRAVCDHVGLAPRFERSSQFAPETRALDRTGRLIELTRRLGGERYLNLEGGRALYGPGPFAEAGLELRFLAPRLEPYPQGRKADFVPGLSVLDALMWTPPETVRDMALGGEIAP
ncbi:WbqC family protein [Roseobacter sp. HKCCA0434]|uniref:WbqC family protein n=1 Tax=Roseobacter sp. HKCCA0434 TaxID=3079297 RepID=UPI0029058F94|nr:WbqC family protein [Roseobacter sp. HKCCA0434]